MEKEKKDSFMSAEQNSLVIGYEGVKCKSPSEKDMSWCLGGTMSMHIKTILIISVLLG